MGSWHKVNSRDTLSEIVFLKARARDAGIGMAFRWGWLLRYRAGYGSAAFVIMALFDAIITYNLGYGLIMSKRRRVAAGRRAMIKSRCPRSGGRSKPTTTTCQLQIDGSAINQNAFFHLASYTSTLESRARTLQGREQSQLPGHQASTHVLLQGMRLPPSSI
jgi:hypothetical protein